MMRRAAIAMLLLLGATPLAQAQGDPSFNLVNQTGRNIVEVYASPSSQSDWGHDRLGSEMIPAGRSYVIRLPQGECQYDVRVVVQGAAPEERRNLDLCNTRDLVFGNNAGGGGAAGKGGSARPSRTGNPSFNLVNRGQQEIRELYASPSSDNDWGPDRLGNDTVAPGRTFPVRLVAGECTYDVRVVYANGRADERRRIDLCSVNAMPFP